VLEVHQNLRTVFEIAKRKHSRSTFLIETFIYQILNGRMIDRRQICTKDGKRDYLTE